jgi:signal transduction histidine kinase
MFFLLTLMFYILLMPQSNQCIYKLENYDNKWRQTGVERTASYFNVPPGHYTFRVKGSNSNGIWFEKSIEVIISPPWWQTWWAYSILCILVGAAIWVFVAYRSRALRRENRILEEKVSQRTIELKQSLENLKLTQAQLVQSEKMASLGELTAGIAHEIQNPLNFVNNFSEVSNEMLDEMKEQLAAIATASEAGSRKQGNVQLAMGLADNVKQNLEKINHHGKRADAIVKGMLQHARTTGGQKEPTDINALADEYIRLAYHGMRTKDNSFNAIPIAIGIETDFDNTIGKINIVPQEIGRVILNLVNNAFYAINEKRQKNVAGYEPKLTVTTKKLDGKVEINVKDNGNGISPAIIDKIFQPFFTTKPTGQGTGLGLSLAYDIVKAHGGNLRVETNEGQGSAFIMILPI